MISSAYLWDRIKLGSRGGPTLLHGGLQHSRITWRTPGGPYDQSIIPPDVKLTSSTRFKLAAAEHLGL